MRGARAIIVATLTLLPVAAAAADFVPPEGCEPYLSVQGRACTVSLHYTCAEVPGHLFRADFDEHGAFYEGEIDDEAQWVQSRSLPSGDTWVTLFPAPDVALVTTLLATGYDDWTFEEVQPGGLRVRVEGFDRLTGETATIDGEELLRTGYETRYYRPDGSLIRESNGREYVSARHRRFFSGVRTSQSGDDETVRDNTPVEFRYPGEPDFLSTEPRYNCGPMLSALRVPEDRA